MKKEDRKERLSLTLLIAVLVFAIQLFSVIVAVIIIVILMKTGIIKELSEELLAPRNTLFLMSVISLLAGALVATFSGKLYLRPVNRFLNQMNRLASGILKPGSNLENPLRPIRHSRRSRKASISWLRNWKARKCSVLILSITFPMNSRHPSYPSPALPSC